MTSVKTLSLPDALRRSPQQAEFKNKFVGLGLPNENWGLGKLLLSQPSVTWGLAMDRSARTPYSEGWEYPNEYLQKLLDKEELIMMLVNQHHNLTHPKVLSTPLGVARGTGHQIWDAMQSLDAKNVSKDSRRLLFSLGSDYAFRPSIRECCEERPRKILRHGANAEE